MLRIDGVLPNGTIVVLAEHMLTKLKNDFSLAFIDLARLGRTNWQATALTIGLVTFLSVVSNLSVLIFTGWSIYFKHFDVVR